jgi:hypothetical protein
LLTSKKAEESALMMGELLLLVVPKFSFGETNIAINVNKERLITEATRYLFKISST